MKDCAGPEHRTHDLLNTNRTAHPTDLADSAKREREKERERERERETKNKMALADVFIALEATIFHDCFRGLRWEFSLQE